MYLNIAAQLKPQLKQIDGFISVEHFQSLTHPDKMLSLSFFRNEAAIETWRNMQQHRRAQHIGRESAFADHRLRITQVVRDYELHERDQAPADSRAEHT
ncbi:antibiotic biosynthesis monooxygenase [Ralstonia solanacearum]|uniref:Antibiotic biosynthesis monooxygenase n=1 Tax=Ralstonia solanacearum TaxID=305 RepID=A0AAW5ZS33_RALSL|nr:antibiotic biosynthesis monooxygenase [Ralstonia solanacearum]